MMNQIKSDKKRPVIGYFQEINFFLLYDILFRLVFVFYLIHLETYVYIFVLNY